MDGASSSGIPRLMGIASRVAEWTASALSRSASAPAPVSPTRDDDDQSTHDELSESAPTRSAEVDRSAPKLQTDEPLRYSDRHLPSSVFESSLEEPMPRLGRLPSQALTLVSESAHSDDLETAATAEAKDRIPSFSQLLPPTSVARTDGTASPSSPAGFKHHRRASSTTNHAVKETLDAQSTEGASGERRLNQYAIGEELGKGSFGSVVEVTDENSGARYAMKEFSKARLRRRLAAERARADARRTGRVARPSPRRSSSGTTPEELQDALALIRVEVRCVRQRLLRDARSVLMKLRHPNIASLCEVLDVPHGDSLYMVLELCEGASQFDVELTHAGGPVIDLSLSNPEAVPPQIARSYFRQALLALEYLHHQAIAHRDLKPDNLLLSRREPQSVNNIVKLVDFGVSDAFVHAADDRTATRAGSPAFLAPELCVGA